MKVKALFSICALMIIAQAALSQQLSRSAEPQAINGGEFPVYGTDIILLDDAGQDQRYSDIAAAPNGWLYACFTVGSGGFHLTKSTDHGLTWSASPLMLQGYLFSQLSLVACGNDAADLKIFVAGTGSLRANRAASEVILQPFDASMTPGNFRTLDSKSTGGYGGMAIATDFPYPSTGASPYSIGLAFTTHTPPADTAVFMASGDGGNTFTTRKTLGISWGSYGYGDVAIAHARSSGNPAGIYFVAIEEPLSEISGKIWETHNKTAFNSDFNYMVSMDDAAGLSTLCRNPSIACQHNNIANGSGGVTVAILFERYAGVGNFNIAGTGNKDPLGSGFWSRLDITSNSKRNIQPDISFDASLNNFMVTWFDSTAQQLNYTAKGQDLPDPASWQIIKQGYNDQANLIAPHPRVVLNPVKQKAVHVWTAERSGGNGIAMFDPEYPIAGIADRDRMAGSFTSKVYPNPAHGELFIEINSSQTGMVTFEIEDLSGRIVYSATTNLQAGTTVLPAGISGLQSGMYLYRLRSDKGNSQGKFMVSSW